MNVCAPFAGIVHYLVSAGDTVSAGQTLASVETVKLEAPVLAPGPGLVQRLAHPDFADVSGGDVLLTVVPLP